MLKGSIKSWRRDRGFGFINVDGQDDDVFVHISELRSLGRPPRIGDQISFSLETQENGKVRAIKCKIKDQNQADKSDAKTNKPMIAIGIAAAIVICTLAYYFFSK